jgi:hypothetical protein
VAYRSYSSKNSAACPDLQMLDVVPQLSLRWWPLQARCDANPRLLAEFPGPVLILHKETFNVSISLLENRHLHTILTFFHLWVSRLVQYLKCKIGFLKISHRTLIFKDISVFLSLADTSEYGWCGEIGMDKRPPHDLTVCSQNQLQMLPISKIYLVLHCNLVYSEDFISLNMGFHVQFLNIRVRRKHCR